VDDPISDEAADAVEVLFRAEAARLFGYACTLPGVSHSDAEDLVQVTFYAAAVDWERRLSQLDEESRRKWLHRVLRNKAVDQWRAASRRLPLESAEAVPAALRETHHEALCSIVLQQYWDRIARMPPVRQRVASLKCGEDWSWRISPACSGSPPPPCGCT
jgi:RNA polymerase sigma-70 factor (ECF subfamily)